RLGHSGIATDTDNIAYWLDTGHTSSIATRAPLHELRWRWLRSRLSRHVGILDKHTALVVFTSPAMDYFVTRLYSQGRVTPKHVRHPVRGQLSVCEEHDTERNRVVKIARLVVPASVGKESPPPLYDAVMLGLTGDWLSLSGFERLAAGSLS